MLSVWARRVGDIPALLNRGYDLVRVNIQAVLEAVVYLLARRAETRSDEGEEFFRAVERYGWGGIRVDADDGGRDIGRRSERLWGDGRDDARTAVDLRGDGEDAHLAGRSGHLETHFLLHHDHERRRLVGCLQETDGR